MSFKVGDKVTCDFGLTGVVLSVDSDSMHGGMIQPIEVIFESNSNIQYFTPEGIYHPGKKTKYDIRHLTPLEEFL